MYDRERTQGLVDEARRLTAALKVETREIGRVIERAFDNEKLHAVSHGHDQIVSAPRRPRWWFWR
jgi:hypothetical protein